MNFKFWNEVGRAVTLGAVTIVVLESFNVDFSIWIYQHLLNEHGGIQGHLAEWAAASLVWGLGWRWLSSRKAKKEDTSAKT